MCERIRVQNHKFFEIGKCAAKNRPIFFVATKIVTSKVMCRINQFSENNEQRNIGNSSTESYEHRSDFIN